MGGYSTPVIDENWRAFAQIIYVGASAYQEHFIVCAGSDGFYLYTQNSSDMSDWDNGLLILTQPGNRLYHYPVLIGNGGDSHDSGGHGFKLYFAYDEDTESGEHKMVRRQIIFDS